MAILHLPHEPNTPAGKVVKSAAFQNNNEKFTIVFKSDPYLGDLVNELSLSFAENILKLNVIENDFKWINWMFQLPEDESITLFLVDPVTKSQCVLVMDGLYLQEHNLSLGNSISEQNEHFLAISFASIEQIGKKGVIGFRLLQENNDSKEKSIDDFEA